MALRHDGATNYSHTSARQLGASVRIDEFVVFGVRPRRVLTDAIDGFVRDTRFLIHDRDPLFSASFRATLGAVGVETVKCRRGVRI